MSNEMQERPAFEYARRAAIGSHWSNRHSDGKHFKNYGVRPPQHASAGKTMSWMVQRTCKGIPQPKEGYEAFGKTWCAPCDMGVSVAQWRAAVATGEAPAKDRVYWIGHASQLLCLANGTNILFDPIFSHRASPLSFAGPARRYPPATTVAQLPPIHIVTVSHNHYDHLDKESVKAVVARFPDVRFVVPLRLDGALRSFGVPATSITTLDWYEACVVGKVRIGCTPAQHWGKRSAFDDNEVLWCGWCIGWQPDKQASPLPEDDQHTATEKPEQESLSGSESTADTPATAQLEWNKYKKYFFTGDTAYNADVSTSVYAHFGAMDMAAIPIGAYEPRWFMSRAHVDPEHAVQIFQDQHVQQAMGVHWGTFELADEPLDEPPVLVSEAMKSAGLDPDRFRTIQMGAHIDF